ncbi:MAG: exopolyphosphatase [Proteobacteria bacterium]|nr:MAG: exopolyphosphatase [Pseudomonadota bacterium]
MSVLAAIDLGSNAIRLAVAALEASSKLALIENFREPIRLGHDVFTNGVISEEISKRALQAFKKFSALMKKYGVTHSRAVGTSALREARNRQVFIDRVASESGIHLEVIEGEEEARLIHLAVSAKVDLRDKTALLVDIGGGSVEITLNRDGDIVFSDSMKMGAVRLKEMLGESKREQREFLRMVKEYALGIKERLRNKLGRQALDLCIGTGGNIEAFGMLRTELLKEKSSSQISAAELGTLLEKLQGMSPEQRASDLGLRPDRADVIVPAGIVLLQLLQQVKAERLQIPGVGLKEGLLQELIPETEVQRKAFRRRQIVAYAVAVGRKYEFDEQHAQTVAKFALDLFDRTKPLHKLNSDSRLLLEVASLLHDVGQFINVNSHHKHSYYLLKAAPFIGLNQGQKDVVANIARYHRKALPKGDHSGFGELKQDDRERVKKLAALLRLAEGLDRERVRGVNEIDVDWDDKNFRLSLRGEGDLLLEKWAVCNKADLFEDVYKLKFKLKN